MTLSRDERIERIRAARNEVMRRERSALADIDRMPFGEAAMAGLEADVRQERIERAVREAGHRERNRDAIAAAAAQARADARDDVARAHIAKLVSLLGYSGERAALLEVQLKAAPVGSTVAAPEHSIKKVDAAPSFDVKARSASGRRARAR